MIWYVARAGGAVAYLLLTFTVCVGIGLAGRARVPGFPRLAVNDLHHFAGIAVWALATVHGITAGSDNATGWMLATYAAAVATVGGPAYRRFAEHASAGGPGVRAAQPVTQPATDSAS